MNNPYRTFIKILIIIFLSTTIVMIMYTFTINTSLNTVKDEIQTNNMNQIRFVTTNLDHNIEQLMMLSAALDNDTKVKMLSTIQLLDTYDQIKLILDLTEKMSLQSFSEGWNNSIAIYSKNIDKWIGSSIVSTNELPTSHNELWLFNEQDKQFMSFREHDSYTIRVSFSLNNLEEIIKNSSEDNNYSFFVNSDRSFILDNGLNREVSLEIVEKLSKQLNDSEGHFIISVNEQNYMVNYSKSKLLNWNLINYIPLDETLKPIQNTKQIFYISCIMLFIAGTIIAAYFYRKVQIPIITLLKGVRTLKHGTFSHRILRKSNNEFDLLYSNFNDMAQQIEDLIEKVYKEQITSREAMLKQLQSQINPHFLYNCLFFINNMTRLGNEEAVTAMTQNLAQYFRYTTRVDEPLTSLEKELKVVSNYLQIQSLRMNRLSYTINLIDSMTKLKIPKLLIQPLVENSIVHGIENKQNSGYVRISSSEDERNYYISVEDDGIGISEKQLITLLQRIKLPPDESMGCALWNISQRLHIHFGELASIRFMPSDLGGLLVIISFPKDTVEKEE